MDSVRDLRVVSRVSLDYLVMLLSAIVHQSGRDLVDVLILLTMGVSNVAHLNTAPNREASRQFSGLGEPVPDDLRRPVSRMQVANSLGLHREPARRRINALVSDGLLLQTPEGLVVGADRLQADRILGLARVNLSLVRRMIANLREHEVAI